MLVSLHRVRTKCNILWPATRPRVPDHELPRQSVTRYEATLLPRLAHLEPELDRPNAVIHEVPLLNGYAFCSEAVVQTHNSASLPTTSTTMSRPTVLPSLHSIQHATIAGREESADRRNFGPSSGVGVSGGRPHRATLRCAS